MTNHLISFFLLFTFFFSHVFAQSDDIANVRNMPSGSQVTVSGIVTTGAEFHPDNRYIQDQTAGISIFSILASDLNPGDSIKLSGELGEFFGLLQIDNLISLDVISTGNVLPEPKSITLHDGFSLDNESMLVTLNDVTFSETGTFSGDANYTVNDGVNSGEVRINSGTGIQQSPIPETPLSITGILSSFQGNIQLLPRSLDDFELAENLPFITTSLSQKNITPNGFTISFETLNEGTSQVRYGNTADNLDTYVIEGNLKTTHQLNITGLSAAELYYIQGFSVSSTNDTSFSNIKPMMTKSLSSGEINVYFNASVDHSAAKDELAVYVQETFADTIIKYIRKATETIDIAIYNLDNQNGIIDAINQASADGVQVRFIGNHSINQHIFNSLDIGEQNKIKSPVNSTPSGDFYALMHHKFVAIDAHAANPYKSYLITGSTNFTNWQLKSDPNNIIVFQDQSIAKAYTLQFEHMFEGNFGSEKTFRGPREFNIGGSRVQVFHGPADKLEERLFETISTAEHELHFGLFMFTRFNISNHIISRFHPEFYCTGIIGDTSFGDYAFHLLIDGGIDEYVVDEDNGYMFHHKYMIIDPHHLDADPLVWTGSYNWSNAGRLRNDENVVVVHDARVANLFYQEYRQRMLDNGITLPEREFVSSNTGRLEYIPSTPIIYPNPASDYIYIEWKDIDGSNLSVKIYDIKGKVHYSKNFTLNQHLLFEKLDVKALQSGMYFIQFNSGNDQQTKKLIVF